MNSKKENAGARKVRKWRAYFLTAVLAITFICNSSGIAYADNGPGELYARAAVLMDADSGRALYEKNGDEMLPNASTTKVLTCILALEEGDLSDVCEVSAYAASQPAVRMGVKAGEQYLLGDLLYALMLESDNDAAVIIAESVAGSVEAFAELMNQKAWDLGCESTALASPRTGWTRQMRTEFMRPRPPIWLESCLTRFRIRSSLRSRRQIRIHSPVWTARAR